MISDYLSQVLTSAGLSAALVGFGAWLLRYWLSERMKRAIKSEYDQKLETHKAQLKAESDIAIEKIRADLAIKTAERQIQFTRLHEERAEVIAETYALLTDLHIKLGEYVKIFEPAGDKPKEERRKEVQGAHKAFIDYYPRRRIFLPPSAVKKIDDVNQESVSAFYDFFYQVEAYQEKGSHDTRAWLEIFKKVRDQMPKALGELERDFRALLGDHSEQSHADDPRISGG